ncbi:Dipeptidyl peptidase 3 [Caenorhabditis elegans]|uniref:Dipeptidyl peptidase 3 n=2 Tax=Caenorhabditis elegans TaxID=6239 RepID=G5ECW7_CAEEL|nr:Dipeptidyl peptidase 3 [Caenorhabditis elegans]CAJ43905.2 Dipeptidyl peptidase 3 [Caenorhabditis elegans]|eukprot:NP_001040648.2 Dipeptidyl peptidase 3 [Caenorhabditis elegans]
MNGQVSLLLRRAISVKTFHLKRFVSTSTFSFSNSLPYKMPVDRSLYIIPNETPVCQLDAADAFKTLSEKEKKYSHYVAKASFDGALAVFLQVSPESAPIFYVLYRLFKSESVEQLKEKALSVGFTDAEWQAFLVYAAAFYSNSGNYKGFGDTKIVPGVEQTKIRALLEKSAVGTDEKVMKTWESVEKVIGSLESNELQLGFGDKGVTCYHSSNVTKADAEKIDRFFKQRNVESWNSRLFKEVGSDGKTTYTIKLASSEEGIVSEAVEFEGDVVQIVRGDYALIMKRTHEWLDKAIPTAANKNQEEMLRKYVEHFKKGDIALHKDGSRYWIKDVGPAVESYIGFIENYRDPAGTRSEFEGFVAAVNKETSKKFQTLVANAENILKRLPWGTDYEKDTFLKPDFTALDVIAFGSSGIPAGINIPNYDDIRQNEGFKNVSLGNVISAQPKQKMNFLDEHDEELMFKYHKDSFEVQVGLHELLGHGSGKLFQKNLDGTFNFDTNKVKDIITGAPIATWYEPGETWSSKFGPLASAYEECRAEAVGYVLCCDADILEIFGYTGDLAQEVKYVNWLSEIRAGLLALEFYQAEQKKWGQAHCYARYVLTKVVLEAGQGFVKIEETKGEDGKPDLHFKLDRNLIDSVGRPAVNTFLAKLQAYKSTGDFEGGKRLFESYGVVGDTELHWRDICIARRKPRRLFVQPNTVEKNGEISLVTYSSDVSGVIQSFVERYEKSAVEDLYACWKDDQKWF